MSIIVRNIQRPTRAIVEKFKTLSVSTVYEAIGKDAKVVMDSSIKPIAAGMKLAGPAITVQSYPADNITVHRAMLLAQPGDVIVVAAHGSLGAMWGAQMTYQAMKQGIAGVVVDGAIRDAAEIREMGFPCFTKIISPIGSAKENPGSINIPIQCGGVVVNPGDIIVGDDDGVVVVQWKSAEEVLEKALKRKAKEREFRKLMDQGKTLFELYGFDRVFKESKVKEVDNYP